MFHFYLIFLLALLSIITPKTSMALPIDWHGAFGVDSTLIDSYRRVERTDDQSGLGANGSQEVPLATGNHANASFQTYLLKLQPVIVVNDAASLKGELTTGYGRGGRPGDDSGTSKDGNFANSLYYHNTPSQTNSGINLNQFYMELYSDTATYMLGRHTQDWGLGAVINSGNGDWDRHLTVRDGGTMKIKLGNFDVRPFFAKIASAGASASTQSLTRSTKLKEYGFSLLYDNIDNDMAMGVYYAKRQNNAFNSTIGADINDSPSTKSNVPLGKSDVKITDIYLKKRWKNLSLGVEIPIMSGELGDLYQSGNQAKYKAKAFIFETKLELNDSWSLNLNFGDVSGDSGGQSSFDAMFLNPNYHIANLLFKYNLRAVSDPSNKNIFDSHVVNTKFAKFGIAYTSDTSRWSTAIIWAKANEVALTNQRSYNHETNTQFDAVKNQSDDLGYEVDMDYDYLWNNEVTLGVSGGYHFAGDYFNFTNDTTTSNSVKNAFVLQLKANVHF